MANDLYHKDRYIDTGLYVGELGVLVLTGPYKCDKSIE